MKLIADLHTHTVATSHAYNPYSEMAERAAQLGYKALAVTDHAPAMPDAPHNWHFLNLAAALPRMAHGVVLLRGVEANVMDLDGGLDFSLRELAGFEWVVASIHSPCLPGLLTEKEATRLWLNIAENPYVDCIGHSEQQNYRYDYDLVTKAFARNHKVVELNGNSFTVRPDGIGNMRELVLACLKNGCRMTLDSDAHSVRQMDTSTARLLALLEEVHFPEELLVNAGAETLANELKLHGKPGADEIGGLLL